MIPLGIAVTIQLINEILLEYKRGQKDKSVNNKFYKRLDSHTGQVNLIKSSQIIVGDIIQLSQFERCPADMVLIYSTDKSGTSFFQSDELDGQTDAKIRKAVEVVQSKMLSYKDIQYFINCQIKYEEPCASMNTFNGVFTHPGEQFDYAIDRDIVENLSVENVIWSNMSMVSQGFMLGVVIYTG